MAKMEAKTFIPQYKDCYIPKTSDQDIIVDVAIGDGQEGSYSVFLGKNLVKSNAEANIGKKADVAGKKTTVSVTIVDELKETNWTSMTVFFSEGGERTQFGPYKMQAENHLDTVIYTLKLIH